MTTAMAGAGSFQTIAAFSEESGAISGSFSSELADYAGSLRELVRRRTPRLTRPSASHIPHLELFGTLPREVKRVLEQINDVLALPIDWDSYGGKAISKTAALAAFTWFDQIYRPGLPAPSVVPGSDGSIQLEWHTRGIDLEVLFLPSGAAEYAFENRAVGILHEGSLNRGNKRGGALVGELVERGKVI